MHNSIVEVDVLTATENKVYCLNGVGKQTKEIGDKECFPVSRITSVRATIQLITPGTTLEYITRKEGAAICVTRVK